MASPTLAEEVEKRFYMARLESRPFVGKRNKCGDYPILPLTNDAQFLAAAKASAAVMRKQRHSLRTYGDDPEAWPEVTPEEAKHALLHPITRDDAIRPSEAFLGIRLVDLPRPFFEQRERFSQDGTKHREPTELLVVETGVVAKLREAVQKPGTISCEFNEFKRWALCLSHQRAKSRDEAMMAALKWLGCKPNDLVVLFGSQDKW